MSNAKIYTATPLIDADRTKVQGIVKEFLQEHTAYYGWFIKTYSSTLTLPIYCQIATSFQDAHPEIRVDLEEIVPMFHEVNNLPHSTLWSR